MTTKPKTQIEHIATELNPLAWSAVATKESAKASKELGVDVLFVTTSPDAPCGSLVRANTLEALRKGVFIAWPAHRPSGFAAVDPITKLETPIRKTEKGCVVL